MSKMTLKSACAVAAMSVAMTSTAQAQLTELVVTALKREQTITDVGLSLAAFGSEAIREARIENPQDISELVSNVDIKATLGGSNPAITVRGVGLNDFNANNNPSVGVYIDDVFISSPALLNYMMFDVERVEVLKGPQGTLYGRNTNGGAIKIINTRPSDEFGGYGSIGYGDYDTFEVEGAVGGPVGDQAAVRLSARYMEQGESFHENRITGSDFGETEIYAVRGQVSLTPDGAPIDANLSVSFASHEGPSTPASHFGAFDPAGAFDPTDLASFCTPLLNGLAGGSYTTPTPGCVDFFGFAEPDTDPFTHSMSAEAQDKFKIDTDVVGGSLELNWDIGEVQLTSITGYYQTDRTYGDNINSQPLEFSVITHDEEISQFSQELRLAGENGPANWIVGGFYSKDEFESENLFESLDLFGTDLFWFNDQTTTAWAVFGNIDWTLNDQWNLITGIRYSSEEVEFTGGTTDLNPVGFSCILDLGCDPGFVGPFTLTGVDSEIDDENVSGRVALEYRPNDDHLIYGSVSSGFKSGGFFGDFTFDNGELAPFDAETILAYELGFKSTLAEGAAQLNGAVFYYDYEDIQTLVPGTLILRFTNAEEAEIFGAEVDLAVNPIEGLDLNLGIGYVDTELSQAGLGDELPNAPEISITAGGRYEFGIANGMSAALQANVKYSSDQFRDAFNDPVAATEDYYLVNGRVSLFDDEGRWEVALWGKNLTDEEYTESNFNFFDISGVVARLYGPPRTYGVSLTTKF